MYQTKAQVRAAAWKTIGLIKGPEVLLLTREEIPTVLGQLCRCRTGVISLTDLATNINWVASLEIICSSCGTLSLIQIIPSRGEVLPVLSMNSTTQANHLLEAVS